MQAIKPVTKPTKQRKMIFQAPDHIRHKLFAASLSPELKASHGVKTLPVRNGDTVRVMRGDHKGFEGKVTRVYRRKYKIYVEGLTREKADGTAIFVPIHPSKVMITSLNLEDKWRKKVLERKKEALKEVEKAVAKPLEKPPKEIVEAKEEVIEEKVIVEEKPKRRKRKVTKKPPAEKVKKKVEKAEKEEEKPKEKKTRAKRKTAKKKTEGET